MENSEDVPDGHFDVVVVGSCFCDLLTYVESSPKPGEVRRGKKFIFDFGGKGANTCIMAAKLHARTAMVSVVGNDVFGRETLGNFKKFGVNIDYISITDEAATGITNCIVNDAGEPAFITLPGASKLLTAEHLHKSKRIIKNAKVLMTNRGIQLPMALMALKLGKRYGSITMFNPAPKLTELDSEFYTVTDIFVLNMEEAESLINASVSNEVEARAACLWFHERGVHRVVVTMRESGAIGSEKISLSDSQTSLATTVFHVPAKKANMVDTTGAGDALAGALAFFLSCYPQLSFKEMVMRAVAIATKTVEIEGVQKSYPDRKCLPVELFC